MTIDLDQVRGRNVLLKVAYDLPTLEDTDRISTTLATINLLLKHNNRVLICTHWGRPNGFEEQYSTKHLIPILNKLYKKEYGVDIDAQYLDQLTYFKKKNEGRLLRVLNLFKSSVIMLENTRFLAAEQGSNITERQLLANQYAAIVDVVVDDAFALSHRQEVTNTEIKDRVTSTFGLHYNSEIAALEYFKTPELPFYLILGGAKLETKLPILKHLLPIANKVLLAGQAAFAFMQLDERVDLKNTFVDSSNHELVKELWEKYAEKIVLPIDLVFDSEDKAMDIGTNTSDLFSTELESAKSLFWNGPLGKYEDEQFAQGTKLVLGTVAKLRSTYTVIGGGDTVSLLTPARKSKISYVSTGGGATLQYLASL
jgi:phosphoglycerate kinase